MVAPRPSNERPFLPKTVVMATATGFLTRAEPGFPPALLGLARAPQALWFRGRLPAGEERLVAVVGARAASRAGVERAFSLANDLGTRGVGVVSGGALGIDAAAHRGSLAGGASTFAVLGCGVDVAYPDRNAPLFAALAARGGVLSQFPPGTPPRPGQFPVRNRVVAALAAAVVVVEARRRSGALITARVGRELGRPVMALAGSPGADDLIGAGFAVDVKDAADVLAVLAGTKTSSSPSLPAWVAPLVAALAHEPGDAAALAQRLGLPVGAALGLLGRAELDGWVRRIGGGRFEVLRG